MFPEVSHLPKDAPAPSDLPSHEVRESLMTAIVAAVRVAIIGGVAIALIEWAVAATSVTHRIEGGLPLTLFVAAAGKACVTHVLFWLIVLIPVAAAHHFIAGRKRRGPPDAFLTAAFVALAALAVLPIDLELVGRRTVVMTSAAIGAGLVAAVAAYFVVRVAVGRLGVRMFRRIANVKAALFGAVGVAAVFAFVRSPFFDPGAYCVPRESLDARCHPKSPNVLWIVLDTVRADHLGCYGGNDGTTPNLDQWAAGSTVFDRAVANAIWTVPSHASMFTGKSVREHGVDFDHLRLSDGQTTVAAELRARGYRTAAFSNNPWISRDTHLARGFDHCELMRHLPRLGRFSLEYLCQRLGVTPFVPWLDGDMGAALTNVEVDRWLSEQVTNDAPLFVYVNYMEAHSPYAAPKAYRSRFMSSEQVDRSYDLRWSVYGYIVPTLSVRFNVEGGAFLPESDREVLKRQYDSAIRYLDDRVAELIGLYRERGILNDTLVIIASDHGEYLDTHRMWGHRYQAYDDVTHTALIVRAPGQTEGRRVSASVQLSDLYDTVLAATNDNSGSDAYPRNLLSTANKSAPRYAVSEYTGPVPSTIAQGRATGIPTGDYRDDPQLAVQDGRYTFLLSTAGKRELYDVVADPTESTNLVHTRPADAKRLADYLSTWLEQTREFKPTDNDEAAPMSPAVKNALKSLGYAGD